MATIQAYRAFDIREVIRPGGSLSLDDDRIVIRHGEWRSSFTGDFHAVPTGVVGDLQRHLPDRRRQAGLRGRGRPLGFHGIRHPGAEGQ